MRRPPIFLTSQQILLLEDDQKQTPLFETQIVVNNDAEAAAKLAPQNEISSQASENAEEDFNLEDVLVDGQMVEAFPGDDSAPFEFGNPESTAVANEQFTHAEGTSDLAVLPIVGGSHSVYACG